MLNEFMKRCTWSPDKDHVIRNNFKKRIDHRLSDAFSVAQRKSKRPSWVLPDHWEELLKYWTTDDFKEKREQTKAARNFEKGGSLHTCGSVSMGTHKRRLLLLGDPQHVMRFGRRPTQKTKSGKKVGLRHGLRRLIIGIKKQWKSSLGASRPMSKASQSCHRRKKLSHYD